MDSFLRQLIANATEAAVVGADEDQLYIALLAHVAYGETHQGVGVEGGLVHDEPRIVEEVHHAVRQVAARERVAALEIVERGEDVYEVLDIDPYAVFVSAAQDVR